MNADTANTPTLHRTFEAFAVPTPSGAGKEDALPLTAVADAAGKGDWAAATEATERVLDVLVRSIVARDEAVVRAIGEAAASLSLEVTVDHDIPARPEPATVASLLRALAGAAAVAGRGTARREDANTRTRLLEAVALARGRPLTNNELARACNRSVETIARILGPMRREGLILSRQAGRAKQNWITEAGRRAYEGRDSVPTYVKILAPAEPPAESVSVPELLVVQQALEPADEVNTIKQVMAVA